MKLESDKLVAIFKRVEENEKKQRNMKTFLRPGSKTFLEHDLKIQMLHRSNGINQGTIELKQTYICIKKHSSFKEFDQLEKIVLNQMYVNKVHEGKYLEGRIIYKPFAVAAVQTLIEDENGDIETLSIYNLIKDFGENLENVLPLGFAVKIKEPYLKTSIHDANNFAIRVDSPSDLQIIISIPKSIDHNLATLCEKYNNEGNGHFLNKEYHLAVHSYTRALNFQQCAKFFSNRSMAYLKLEWYQNALIDAEKSVQLEPSEKAYFRMATAWYNMRQFDKSMEQFKNCLKSNASNREAKIGLDKCLKRIEETKGVYDFKYFIDQSGPGNFRVDGADFLSDKIEVANISKKGRGFVAKVNIPKGTLLVASKALSISFDCEFKSKYNLISFNLLNRSMDKNSQCQNLMNLIYKMRFDPYLRRQVYTLYAGKNFTQDQVPPNEIIDTERIEAIHSFNSFKADDLRMLGEDFDNSGLWHVPSFFNHSCLPNTYRVHFSDFVFIFTNQDVKQGEELTLAYFPLYSFEEREKRAEYYGFKCYCPICQEDRNDLVNVKKRANLIKNLDQMKKTNDKEKLSNLIENLKKTYQKRDRYKYDLIMPLCYLATCFQFEFKLTETKNYFKQVFNLSKESGDLTMAIRLANEINRLSFLNGDKEEIAEWQKTTSDLIQLDSVLIEHISKSNHLLQNNLT